jgi:hypothetical protein
MNWLFLMPPFVPMIYVLCFYFYLILAHLFMGDSGCGGNRGLTHQMSSGVGTVSANPPAFIMETVPTGAWTVDAFLCLTQQMSSGVRTVSANLPAFIMETVPTGAWTADAFLCLAVLYVIGTSFVVSAVYGG